MDPNRPPQQLYAAPNALQQLQLQQLAAAQMAARPGGNPLLAGAGFRPGLQLPAGMQMAQMQYSVPGRPQAMQMRPAGFAMPAGAVPAMPAVPRPLTGPRPPGAQVAQKGYPQRPPGQFAGPQTVAYGVPRPVQQVQQQPPSGTMPAPKIVDEPPISLSGPKSAKKGTDRRIPPEVLPLIPEAKLYQQLLDFEKRLDVNIHKKKFDIQDAVGKPLRTKRTLRIFVSNQAHDQPWQVRAEGPNPTGNAMESTPSWTLRIEGRLMDPGPYRRTAPTDPKFSHFIKTMIVEIQRDQNLYAESNIVEWRKELMPIKDTDGFEIRRRGDEPVEVRILMALDGQPERYKVSPQLAKLLHITGPETKAGLVNRLWQYIKTQKLLDAEDKRLINMDDDLQQIFSTRAIMFPQIPELIARHCLPLDPIDIRYRIVLDQEKFLSKTAWDIEVEVEETSRHRLHPLALGNTPAQQARAKDLKELDDKIGEAMAGLNSSRLKRSFMLAFAEDPAGFTNRWVESQAEDLKLMLGDGRYNPEELRHSEFFEKPEIEEAVAYYLNARMTGTVGTSRK